MVQEADELASERAWLERLHGLRQKLRQDGRAVAVKVVFPEL